MVPVSDGIESGAAITAPPIPDETGKKAIAFTFVMFVPFQYQNVIIEIYRFDENLSQGFQTN
jgi:hypothetical protein